MGWMKQLTRKQASVGYLIQVACCLHDEHGVSPSRAEQLVKKWCRLIDSRFRKGKDPKSTAEHVARFQRGRIVKPYKAGCK